MKKFFYLLINVIIIVTILSLTSCKKTPDKAIAGFDHLDEFPEWLEVTPSHNLNELDNIQDNAVKAVYLFRQACYNLEDIPYYAYFLDGGGNSVFEEAEITLRAQTVHVQNGDDSFHQMVNTLTEMDAGALSGLEGFAKSFLSRSYQRTYYEGVRYYRKGTDSIFNEDNILVAAWEDYDIEQQGEPKTREDFETEEDYLNDKYQTQTFLDFGNYTDSLASLNGDNLVKTEGTTVEEKIDDEGNTYYKVSMAIDISVANADTETIDKLKKDTSTSEVGYSEFTLEFEVWENGLFKSLNPKEGWEGTIKYGIFSVTGGSLASNPRTFSYHPDDYSLDEFTAMLPKD